MYFGQIVATLLFLFYGTSSTQNRCLVDVSVPEISSRQANISWSYSCNTKGLLSFKIYYDHVEYKACAKDDNMNKKHKKKRKKVGGSELFTIIDDLEPYSLYTFEVNAILKGEHITNKPESMKVEAVTEEDLPKLLIKNLTVKDQAASDRITYRWRAPSVEDCDQFNSELGYIFYKITGSDIWNKEYFKEDNLSLSTTELTISSLLPNSLYHLDLYLTNIQGQFHEDTVLQSDMITGPSHPHQPTNLTVTSSSSSHSLQWVSPHPPTGQLVGYKIRWQHSNHEEESEWETSEYLTVDEASCSDTAFRNACYQVKGLDSNKNFSFQVMAFNKAVNEGSLWSDTAKHMASDSDMNMYMVVIVVSLVTAVVLGLLLFLFIMHRCNIWNRLNGFKRTMTDDYSFRPIVRDSESRLSNVSRFSALKKTPVTSPTIISVTSCESNLPSNGSPTSEEDTRNFNPSINRASLNRRSCLDPLPPVPGKDEPVYDEIRKPDTQPLDDDNYLAPIKVASVESLDEEGYLRPNFNRFQMMDTRSPDREALPAIPIVSYSSQDQLEAEIRSSTRL